MRKKQIQEERRMKKEVMKKTTYVDAMTKTKIEEIRKSRGYDNTNDFVVAIISNHYSSFQDLSTRFFLKQFIRNSIKKRDASITIRLYDNNLYERLTHEAARKRLDVSTMLYMILLEFLMNE